MKPTDPLYASQWHFDLLGDIETIWDDYSGAGVKVGVFDTGTEADHPDLDDNYDETLHYDGRSGRGRDDGQPNGSGDGHGTACAGLIAAEANDIGGVGVAWGATVAGVDYLNHLQHYISSDRETYIDSVEHAANFDVVSNSWGALGTYSSAQDIGDTNTGAQITHRAFVHAAETGRDGLGTLITKAAGNDAHSSSIQGSHRTYGNAQGEGLNNSEVVLVVAATQKSGLPQSYSNWGSNVSITAPAASVTTDMTDGGYSYGDHTTGFGGTSAATPVVAGVIGLMLEAAPGLGWRDVHEILAISAAQTGSDFGDGPSGYEMGAWMSNGATTWNGGGLSFNISHGFGMVDAFAAVRMAEVWQTMRPEAATSANDRTASGSWSGRNDTIPDGGVLDAEISVSRDITVEHIFVTVSVDHAYDGDLTVELIGPGGETYLLFDQERGQVGFGGEYTFAVTGARGMSSAGTWTVRLTDARGDGAGTLRDAVLSFRGASADSDSVHTITDDFLELADVETERRVLTDTDGGTDWLNLAALAGDVALDLRAGGQLQVDGQNWAEIGDAAAFENVVSGDGADMLTGNDGDNRLLGMRGDDVLSGGAGADLLDGGAGRDTASYAGSSQGLRADLLLNSENTGEAEGDRYRGIEDLLGSDHADDLRGNEGDNTLRGGAGADFIMGRDGDDWLIGNSGHDILTGNAGDDRLQGCVGNDRLIGGDGDDTLEGGSGNDSLIGGSGNNCYSGGAGRDVLYDGSGRGMLFGGADADRLIAGGGNDRLWGEGGADRLNGGNGNDRLNGGAGADYLVGGSGRDQFVFQNDMGMDRVADFNDTQDRLMFDTALVGNVSSAEDLVSRYGQQSDAGFTFDFGSDDQLTLLGYHGDPTGAILLV